MGVRGAGGSINSAIAFSMGIGSCATFVNMYFAVRSGDYEGMADLVGGALRSSAIYWFIGLLVGVFVDAFGAIER